MTAVVGSFNVDHSHQRENDFFRFPFHQEFVRPPSELPQRSVRSSSPALATCHDLADYILSIAMPFEKRMRIAAVVHFESEVFEAAGK